MDKTLMIMAAGMGSRYGGNKQIDGMGPNNEVLMLYSIYDAINAGFTKVVFIIKRDFEERFRTTVGDVVKDKIKVEETADGKVINVEEDGSKVTVTLTNDGIVIMDTSMVM